jgi:hypothetical protein
MHIDAFGATFEELLGLAKEAENRKIAAVDAQTLMGGGDPAAMAGGMDPMAAGMGPPPGEEMGGGGDTAGLEMRLAALEQQLAAGGGAAGAGGVEPIKPKIDVNVEIMQMKKLLARMADALGVQIPAAEMVATPDDLTQMANQEQQAGGAGGAGASPTSAIPPIEPMQGASPSLAKAAEGNGDDYSEASLVKVSGRAAALAAILAQRKRQAAA